METPGAPHAVYEQWQYNNLITHPRHMLPLGLRDGLSCVHL